jgi:hypothetical protein
LDYLDGYRLFPHWTTTPPAVSCFFNWVGSSKRPGRGTNNRSGRLGFELMDVVAVDGDPS